MKYRAPWVLLMLLVAWAAVAEDELWPPVSYPAIVERASTKAGFVPEGWALEYDISGDLDGEADDDLLLLLKMQEPGNIVEHDGLGTSPYDTNPRLLVVALSDANGGYRRVLADHALVPRPDSPVMDDVLQEDPAAAIRIDRKRVFSISLSTWASAGTWFTGHRSLAFRWQQGCFRLIGLDDWSMHRASGETSEVSINYLNNRAWTRRGSVDDGGEGKKRWQRLSPREPICLEQIGNGFQFETGLKTVSG